MYSKRFKKALKEHMKIASTPFMLLVLLVTITSVTYFVSNALVVDIFVNPAEVASPDPIMPKVEQKTYTQVTPRIKARYVFLDTHISEEIIEEPEPIIEPPVIDYRYDFYWEAYMCAQTVYGEARGIYNITEQANIVWTILNRVDAGYGSIPQNLLSPGNFAYDETFPVIDDYGRNLVEFCQRIILHWAYGDDNGIFRTLPHDYRYYYGDGKHNYFTNSYTMLCDWARVDEVWGYWDYSYGYLPQ